MNIVHRVIAYLLSDLFGMADYVVCLSYMSNYKGYIHLMRAVKNGGKRVFTTTCYEDLEGIFGMILLHNLFLYNPPPIG